MTDIWLAGPLTTSAFGWRLERRDGITFGFSSHDRDVWVDGLQLRASPGLVPTSIVERTGFEDGGLEVKGALTAGAICPEDLRAGRWDGARLDIFLFDWSNPEAGTRPLASGSLGAIEFDASGFTADIEGPAAKLSRSVAPYISPTCRARFCDADCALNVEAFRRRATVASFEDGILALTDVPSAEFPKYDQGEVRWISGPNCGLRHMVNAVSPQGLLLGTPPPFSVIAGDRIELIEGCDKRLSTCSERFANTINFRGEPFVPGNDLLTRYPGA